MATDVARGHGGDGGGKPPRRPGRIPTACESSKPKRTRGYGKNLNLYEEFAKNNSRPLPIEFDATGKQYKFIGHNYQRFIRLISNEVKARVPMHYPSWDDVPEEHKRDIYPTLHHYFDLDRFRGTPHWNGIVLGIDADCANSYKRRKAKLKEHFDEVGGYDDVETAKLHPPKRQSPEAWVKVIDELFITEKYRNRSQQNSGNRELQPYPSGHGSESLAQKRHKEIKASGKAQHIDGWKKNHYKEGPGWVNARAEADWAKIQREYAKMVEEADGESSVDEVECLKRALGERRGHTRGVGRKVKHIPPHYVPPSTSTNTEQFNAMAQLLTQQLNQQFQQFLMSQNPNSQPLSSFQFRIDPSQLQVPQTQTPNNQDIEEDDGSTDDQS